MNAPVLLGPDARPLAPSRAASAFRTPYGFARAYNGASLSDPDLSTWTTQNPSPQVALSTDRQVLAGRIHDLARNDGWAAGGVSRIVDSVVGANWRLSAKPVALALGITPDAASDLADQFESVFKMWAENVDFACDAGERLSWGGLLALAFRHRVWDGEALAVLDWIERPYAYSTCVQVIHPDRLSNPNGARDTQLLRDGVELNDRGAPVAYQFRTAHPGDALYAGANAFVWERVARRTAWGRARVVHAFEPQAASQVRGVSPLAPILKKIRMLGRYDEVELQAAILNAVLAAFVTSPFDGEQLAEAMSSDTAGLSGYQAHRLDWHDKAPISLPGVKVNFLATGEDVKLTNPNHPNSVFEAYERTVLRNIATAIGTTYEQLSMDWSQVNYSSARAGLLEIWRGFTARKKHFASPFAQPIYAAVIEEAIDRGDIKLPKGAPSFYEAKTAYCMADWIGPGRGWIDPQKEALAAIARLEGGLSTLEDECAEQGKDWLEMMQQQARENAMRQKLGLPPIALTQAMVKMAQMTDQPADKKPDDKKDAA